MKKFLTFFFFLSANISFVCSGVFAADFNVKVVRDYFIDSTDKTRVSETHVIENKSTTGWISENNSELFFVSVTSGNAETLTQTLATVQLSIDGSPVSFITDQKEDHAVLSVKLGKAIKPNASITFKIEYDNYGLIEKKGALIDFYAPGFKSTDGEDQTGATTSYTYDTYVNISKSLPELNFITPDPSERGSTDEYTRYFFSYEALLNKYIWAQIGRVQYYKFLITQSVQSTETTSTGYENEYKIIVPRSIDEPQMYQKVYYIRIDPQPSYVETDIDGNLVFAFKMPTTENRTITIEGFAEVGRNSEAINENTVGSIRDGVINDMGNYLSEATYWEVNDPQIKAKAVEIAGTEDNVFLLSQKLYDYVIGKIDYSKVKRFGLNERQGALNTLNGSAAVCMEYSDLYLTLARAAGIPTRAVFGYGYDSKIQNDLQEAHQWVEVFMPGVDKWVSIDVTWGESGMKMAEGNLNHFFTHVASVSPNSPSLVERKSYGLESDLATPVYKIDAYASISDSGGLKTQEMLLAEYPIPVESTNTFTTFINSMNIGSFVSVSGIMIVVGIVLMIVSLIGIVKMLRMDSE